MTSTSASEAPLPQPAKRSTLGDRLQGLIAGPRQSLSRLHARLLAEHSWYGVLVEMVKEYQEHQPSLLAKQAAYSLLSAVPSILILLVSLAAIVDKNTGSSVSDGLRRLVSEQAPGELRPLFDTLVRYALVESSESTAVVAGIVSLVVAIWGGSGGVGALMYGINQVYGLHQTRPFLKAILVQLGLMLLGGVLVIAAIVLFAFGHQLGEWLAPHIGPASVLVGILLAGPLWAVVLLFIATLLLYWFAVDIPKSLRWLFPGTAVTTAGVAIIFALFGLLLSLSNPGSAFGAAGSVLILLWALFLLCQIVIVGAIVNAVLARRHDQKLMTAIQANPEKRTEPAGRTIKVEMLR
jgi:membrane protein